VEFIGAFESTYLPRHDVDILETSGHVRRWQADLALLRETGITRLRYPIRWHRIEAEPAAYDWRSTDEVLGFMRDEGFSPIVDLVHHTSYPRWLLGGFGNMQFGQRYLKFCEAFANRYPWIREYTLFNEPFGTLFLAGHEGIWPPHGRGTVSFIQLLRNVLPAVSRAAAMYRELLPAARHLYVDTCEAHVAADPESEHYAAVANDRRFLVLDLLLGSRLDPSRPYLREVLEAGGEDLLLIEPSAIDVLGLDYYSHSEWYYLRSGGQAPSPEPAGLAALASYYWERYRLPMILSETNIRGFTPDRASWFKFTLEQCEQARREGVPLEGYCWFPFVDSVDWDSLLARADRHIDPVGVYWLDARLDRHPSSMARSFRMAVSGTPASQLPAYRFSPPLNERLTGFHRFMSGWEWQEPPAEEVAAEDRVPVIAEGVAS